jgi:hypothetical protein
LQRCKPDGYTIQDTLIIEDIKTVGELIRMFG